MSTFVSEPYYREYFAEGQNYVQASRSIYSGGSGTDSGDNNGSPVMTHPGMTAYESRLAPIQSANDSYAVHHNNNNTTSVNKNTPIYTKAVTAAGLTVDLPSPDSGIGTDAITPRDQNNIPQVRKKWSCPVYDQHVAVLVDGVKSTETGFEPNKRKMSRV